MFTVAAYLGERLQGGHGGPLTAALSLLAIFLPGLLLVGGMLPLWQFLAAKSAAVRMLAGINAGVVGLLAAALYNPIWISAVQDGLDLAVVLVAFGMLVAARWPAWTVVLWCVTACVLRSV
jgi:chromate transporter